MDAQAVLLVASVAVVGVLHTMVPDHWIPITVLARQRGWSRSETALAAAQAGTGHVATTLLIGLVIWFAGASAASRFGSLVDTIASLALVGFGLWIAVSAWREMRQGDSHAHGGHHHHHPHGDHHLDHTHGHHHDHGPAIDEDRLYAPQPGAAVAMRHIHAHRHGGGPPHEHWHDHDAATAHEVGPDIGAHPPLHVHKHKTSGRTALLLILGSSPMVEGIPAFFAASRFGAGLIAIMAVVFAASTIATYVVLCVLSAEGLQRVSLGPFERYGEIMSGLFIALVGVAFWAWPLA